MSVICDVPSPKVETLDVKQINVDENIVHLQGLQGLSSYLELPDSVKTASNIEFHLDLSHTQVTDVSALGEVHTLNLMNTR